MSASFAWTPATPRPPGGAFGLGLAAILSGRVNGDRQLYDDLDCYELDDTWIHWLNGVADAGNPEVAADARALAEAIVKYKVIRLDVTR